MLAFSRLRKSTTDLQIVSSGKLSQILCNACSGPDTYWGLRIITDITVLLVLSFNKCAKIVKSMDVICVIDWRLVNSLYKLLCLRFYHFYADEHNFTKFSLLMHTAPTNNRRQFRIEILSRF